VKKWREDGGGKQWKTREENRREAVENRQEAGSGGKRGKKIGGRREAVDAREEKWREAVESCRLVGPHSGMPVDPQTSVSRRECPGGAKNPSKTYMGTYDIWVKIN
jgi:hypothetical protein